jgi:hypothetical protein
MKILISIGMIIFFISAFFMFFIFDTSIRSQITCFTNPDAKCGAREIGIFTTGLLMIGLFLIVDIIAAYIILSTGMSESETF